MKTLANRVSVTTVSTMLMLAPLCAAQQAPAPAPAPAPAVAPAVQPPAVQPPAAQPPVVPKPAVVSPPPRPVAIANPPFSMFKMPLPMIQRSVLNNVEGRIDRMVVDLVSNRLFVAAKGNNTVEMLEIATSKQLPPIRDVIEPTGLLLVNDLRKLVLSCSGDNTVRTFALSATGDPTAEKTVKFEGEVDRIGYDAPGKRVFVAHGKKLGSFDIATGERGPSLELPATPEGFSISPSDDRIFVNVQSTGTVAVVKRTSGTGELKLDATWTIKDAKGNYASALDPVAGHLFVVCRNPAKLVVLDTKSGEQVAVLDCVDDTDDAWWDVVNKRLYVSGGGSGGRVDIFQQTAATEAGKSPTYTIFHKETTNVGARASVLVGEQRRLIVAAPKIGIDPTFLYIYLIGP